MATPRIQKPDELGLFRGLLRHQADGILVRNLAGLQFFHQRAVPIVADFSLNAANELTVQYLHEQGAKRVTASYDLNRDQLLDLVAATPASWLEVVIHQHMPMFHMEHCVFCAVLSPGTNKTNCGRPCDIHEVKLRDRVGMEHPLKADVGCRNTLFNASSAEFRGDCAVIADERRPRFSPGIARRSAGPGAAGHRSLPESSGESHHRQGCLEAASGKQPRRCHAGNARATPRPAGNHLVWGRFPNLPNHLDVPEIAG